MKTIVVATDFSAPSEQAAQYAMTLAQKLEARLILCHADPNPMVTEPQALESSEAAGRVSARNFNEGKLQQLAKKLMNEQAPATGWQVPVDTVMLQGDVAQEIAALASDRKADLVVVGAHTEEGAWDLFSENHTNALLEHCLIPVLVVPAQARFLGIRTIVFACDLLDADARHLEWLSQFAQYWGAHVMVLHITGEEADLTKETERMSQFIERLPARIFSSKLSFRLITAESVADELDQVIKTESVDWLAMSAKKRNVFQQLAHRSLTRQMVRTTEIPLLAFHANRVPDIWIL
jgi:nucleotide-binding universal stress UspA family protein